MRQEIINNIIGTTIYTNSGPKLAIGNANHQAGDYVWTDGNCVFGTEMTRYIPPYIPPDGNIYLEAYIDLTTYKLVYRAISISTSGEKVVQDQIKIVENGNPFNTYIAYDKNNFATITEITGGFTVLIYNGDKPETRTINFLFTGNCYLSKFYMEYIDGDLFWSYCLTIEDSNNVGVGASIVSYKNFNLIDNIDFTPQITSLLENIKSEMLTMEADMDKSKPRISEVSGNLSHNYSDCLVSSFEDPGLYGSDVSGVYSATVPEHFDFDYDWSLFNTYAGTTFTTPCFDPSKIVISVSITSVDLINKKIRLEFFSDYTFVIPYFQNFYALSNVGFFIECFKHDTVENAFATNYPFPTAVILYVDRKYNLTASGQDKISDVSYTEISSEASVVKDWYTRFSLGDDKLTITCETNGREVWDSAVWYDYGSRSAYSRTVLLRQNYISNKPDPDDSDITIYVNSRYSFLTDTNSSKLILLNGDIQYNMDGLISIINEKAGYTVTLANINFLVEDIDDDTLFIDFIVYQTNSYSYLYSKIKNTYTFLDQVYLQNMQLNKIPLATALHFINSTT